MTLFYIFADVFCVLLMAKFLSLFLFFICWMFMLWLRYVVLVKVHEENLSSLSYLMEKREVFS